MMKKLLCTLLFTVLAVSFVNAQADVNLQGNATDIADGDTTPDLADFTDFGDVSMGSSFTRTFTIQNTDVGGSNLNLTGPGIAFNFGSDSQFVLGLGGTSTPITNVTPTTFDVTFTAATLGVANATVNVTTDDPDVAEQSYTFAITANVTAAAPDVNLQGNAITIADGDTTPDLADFTNFGDVSLGSSFTRTFTIQNTGGGNLNLTGPGVAFNFGSDSQFVLGLGGTSTPITNVTPTTFDVTFTAATLGAANATVNVTTDDPDVAEQSYTFAVTANVTAAAADVNLQGNAITIADGDTTPDLADFTNFGDVSLGSSFTRTFTIQNTGGGNLNLTGPGVAFNFGSDSQFVLNISGTSSPITNVTPTTFDVTFTAATLGAANATVNVTTDDPDVAEQSYTFAITANVTAAVPDVNLQGNAITIADGDTTPDLADFTNFGDVSLGSSFTRTFTIQNTGGGNLNLTGSGVAFNFGSDSQFVLNTTGTSPLITNITPTTFDVTFTAATLGVANATVNVTTDDPDVAEQSYTFAITANAVSAPSGSPLMITQYYEGTSTTTKWVEVKNISANTVINGSYNLAVFLDGNATTTGASNITNSAPNAAVAIPTLGAGEIALFYRGSSLPTNLGAYNAIVTNTEVCAFTGNDVIVISPSTETTCYNDRIDIMGVVGSTTTDWGSNKSLVKGCGTTLQPAIVYDPTNVNYDSAQFIELTLAEVDNANSTMDIALGTQAFGTTTFTTTWSSGLPDRTRIAIVDGAYTNANGSLSACNLTINSGASIIMNSGGSGNNYVLVTDNLVNNGTLTLGDTESLTITKATGTVSGTLTKIERTTTLNNFRDLTYWSAPVSTTVTSAFVGVDPTRIWLWTTPSSGDTGNWAVASGAMNAGRGYVAEAPSSITAGQQYEVTFTGTPNNGAINVPVGADLTNADGYGGYNIIGNPYPSAIDIDVFLRDQDNDEINNGDDVTTDATVWLWTHGTPLASGEFSAADYATYNLVGGVVTSDPFGASPAPTNIIGSGQGFLIRALSSGSVGFTNSMRVVGQNNTQFYKSQKTVTSEKDRIWLNFKSKDGVLFNQTLIGFMEDATDGYDRGYDGLKLDGGAGVSFYSNLEDDIYAIQGLGAFNESKEVSLGFYTAKAEMHTISIDKMEGVLVDQDIYLVDNELNVVHDLKQGAYEFEVTAAGNYKERFTLKFNSSVLSTEDFNINNGFIVFSENGTLKVKASEEITELKVYDVMGRLLIDSKPKSAAFDIESQQNIKVGTVLILNATMKNGVTVSKKAIKY